MEIYILGEKVNKFYVYQYRDPRNNEVIYIGKGRGGRAYNHLTRCSNRILRNKIQHMRELKLEPIIEFILQDVDESFALFTERLYIAKYGRIDLGTGTLCNFTDGGDGIRNPSEEHRKRIGEAAKNRIISDETRKKLSDARRNISNETRNKKSDAARNISDETRKKLRDAARNRPRVICPHCRREVDSCSYTRWHGDNCKHRI